MLLGWALAELLTYDLERLVGFRYLHRGRRSRWAPTRWSSAARWWWPAS